MEKWQIRCFGTLSHFSFKFDGFLSNFGQRNLEKGPEIFQWSKISCLLISVHSLTISLHSNASIIGRVLTSDRPLSHSHYAKISFSWHASLLACPNGQEKIIDDSQNLYGPQDRQFPARYDGQFQWKGWIFYKRPPSLLLTLGENLTFLTWVTVLIPKRPEKKIYITPEIYLGLKITNFLPDILGDFSEKVKSEMILIILSLMDLSKSKHGEDLGKRGGKLAGPALEAPKNLVWL